MVIGHNYLKLHKKQSGFTLIEMLIVIIILGILATIIVPQISISTDDAKANALKTSLGNMRSAVELYYYHHNNLYPGKKKETDGADTGSDAEAAAAFVAQLTKYSDADGVISNVKDATHKYGPYLKDGPPMNPYNNKDTVVCDFDEDDITERDSTGDDAGWKFYPVTGLLVSGDGGVHNDF